VGRRVKGGISYEDFIYFYRAVSTPTVEPAADRPISLGDYLFANFNCCVWGLFPSN
jgi:hypothetical protein